MGKKTLGFTRASLEALPAAASGTRAYYYDKQISSLQVQVTDRGTKTYFVYKRINGRPRRVKLGRFPDMAPAAARNEARIKLGEIARGIDPDESKREPNS